MDFKKRMIIITLGLMLIFMLMSCRPNKNEEKGHTLIGTKTYFENINSINASKLIKNNKNDDNFVIIDLRTLEEYNEGHIKSARMIDYYQNNFINNLKLLDRNKTYLIYCRTGHRSSDTFRIMKELEFKKVYNLEHGINDWISNGFEIVR